MIIWSGGQFKRVENPQKLSSRIIDALRKQPMTAREIEDWLQEPSGSVRPQLTALRDDGLLCWTGERRRRDGQRKPMNVWTLTDAGR